MQTLYYRWQIQMHSAITLILYGLASPAPPSLYDPPFAPTSWQHVIGHKKLQLCINLWLRSVIGGKSKRNESNEVAPKGRDRDRDRDRMPGAWSGGGDDKDNIVIERLSLHAIKF